MKTLITAFLFFLVSLVSAYAQVDTLVDVGSYKLHFRILKGEMNPILFESGGGLDARQWDSISTVLHGELNATIITYDRQGFGQSGLDTSKFNILDEIKSLELALERLGFANKSKLLVCHSLGAFYSRLYAFRNPYLVTGIIMLDPRIPSYADMRFARSVSSKLTRADFSEKDLGLYYVLAKMERNSDFLRKKSIPANIPIVHIMAEQGPFDTKEENDRFKSAQKNFLKTRANASSVYAKGSSHNIPQDKPDIVVSEILNFYRQNLKNN
ncbi:pimeloyl-ACP methyl ester carboxylesterase [Pedobacter sp. CG_S7]|uniref:alpha/beta fold hydrolase n=1 Tax=Pedobacter sp. CG_S7 TaxID=3143930 RepID=UPI00339A9439